MKIRFNSSDMTQQGDTAIKGALIVVFGSALSAAVPLTQKLT